MTRYGEFDDQYRPHPALWRLAAVGFCQFALAAFLAVFLVSATDMWTLRQADVKTIVAIDPVPWQTLKGELARLLLTPGESNELALRFEREFATLSLPAAGLLLAASIVFGFFWPSRQTLARKMFLLTLSQCVAVFGAALLVNRPSVTHLSTSSPMPYAIDAVALAIVFVVELRMVHLLANVQSMTDPGRRAGYWFARMGPALAGLAAAAELAGNRFIVIACGAFAITTLFANISRRPEGRFETLEEVELKEAAAVLLFVTIPLIAGALWVFRVSANRQIVLVTEKVRIAPVTALPAELQARWKPPTMPQKIEIRWSRRPRSVTPPRTGTR